ncbi:hypothetical protein [Neorhizobium sp. NCHU2750]|nr:hypothetical protein NCHU2750_03330 [Neorhizobium sp. NCHU2750]
MVYEWDEKRARYAKLSRWGATLAVALVFSGISVAAMAWLA